MSKLYVEGFNITYPEELSPYNCSRDIPLRKSWLRPELADNPVCEVYLLQSVGIKEMAVLKFKPIVELSRKDNF
jgi:hypothetical protein